MATQSRTEDPLPARLQRFAELVRRAPEDIPLVEASLEIARDSNPDLDASLYVQKVEDLVREAAGRDPGEGSPSLARLEALNALLFEDHGFHGDPDGNQRPEGSFLNEVLDQRTGLPIMMSVLYMVVGRRIGLDLVGIGMPLHFILRLNGEEPPLYIDAFNKGALLDAKGCGDLLERVSKGQLDLQPEYLSPWSSARILLRMLNNLKAVYISTRDYRRARRIIDLILVIQPGASREIRDRGLLSYQCLLLEQAVEDLTRYVEMEPRSREATAIRGQLESLKRLIPSVN